MMNTKDGMVLPILEATKCDLCGTCVSACPTGALSISEERLVFSAPAECTYCATCEKVCPQQAIHCPLSIAAHPGRVVMKTNLGTSRIVDMLTGDKTLGFPVTGAWTHIHAEVEPIKKGIHTSNEVMAEKVSDYVLLRKNIAKYPVSVVDQVLHILSVLHRSEKVCGVAEWFKNTIQISQAAQNSKIRNNLIWRAVALAPPGYCHISNTMIGTLFDDLAAGMPFDQVKERFAQKMDPTKYQRPQAAPTSGNIERAEKIVEKLGIERSLVRRFARFNEVQKIWMPPQHYSCHKDARSCKIGVFAHLAKELSTTKTTVPEQPITWHKFLRTVLPTAIGMEAYVNSRDNFSAILTAEHMDAPPILQWDSEETRNPFSWYVYKGGSVASQWGLRNGYAKITGICYQPSMWFQENPHQGKSILFILEGARDSHFDTAGNGLFPEILKTELREIRSTIEAYSRKAPILGYDEASACGLRFQEKSSSVLVKVTTQHGSAIYRIDRWD